MIKKLELINELLNKYNGDKLAELVKNKHTQGIWILAEYELLIEVVGLNDEVAKDYIKTKLMS